MENPNVSRRAFARMFRARWQNMQNIVNDSVFYSLVPNSYRPYYYAYIRQWQQWARGFVPDLHKADFFSTGMGYTVCSAMTKECMSGGYRLKSTDAPTKEFLSRWFADELNNVFNKMFFFANAGGNAILVLTPVDGELCPSVYPIDRAVFQIGRTGKISNILLLNRFVSGEDAWYTREQRVMLDGEAYYRVEIARGTLVTAPTFSNTSAANVPEQVKEQWRICYGGIEPNKWYKMPEKLRGIGCYNVRNSAVAVAIADMPGYSDSTLHTALDVLYSIDYNYTQGQVDQYIGRSRTLIPKQMGGVKLIHQPNTLADGMSFRETLDVQGAPLDDTFYTQVPDGNLNGDAIKPMFIQPNLRAQDRKYIRDADLELLASKVGMSASTLASHLSTGGGTKTDDEISAEGSATEKTVGNKRRLASCAINDMLSDVAAFYGFSGRADIQWGRTSANSARENQELLADYQAGTLPLREYLRRRWSDLDEAEVEKMAREVEAEQETRRKAESSDLFGDISTLGGA